ncbi:hypothetical protein M231_01604 [Tremella mesenterica]|uniref:Transporter particle component n=1 Tax=Tremella mesenterica TaxID=5217 RepID=A0A4Q1BT24_TREME|nr:uncharacterized protein TREMEDRAFT_45290 [Tremella mesenterica DSM 1558]EIW67294.1 hypothetical protein TREMEDRAFT_45290 [Tremella mesenterica DSM 1558]RXK41199.1 hypothetical protein M231_01604 [Tremella mesenterica]
MSSRPSSSAAHPPAPAPTVPQAIHQLAIPNPTLIDSHLPTYLLPCVYDVLRQSTAHAIAKKRKAEQDLVDEGLITFSSLSLEKGKGKAEVEEGVVDEELTKRLERIGLMVGGYIAEKLTLARPPLASQLDVIKFICKDLFLFVYSKQIDNLRTNHRGVFVLQSHIFPPLASLSSHKGQAHDQSIAPMHLVFPQALIQGALARLGLPCYVTAESSTLPQCTFQIRTVKSTQPPTPETQSGTPTTADTAAKDGPEDSVKTQMGGTGLGITGAPVS